MRKILIAFDGTRYSESALAFAAKLNERNRVLVAGAFMPQTSLANLWASPGGNVATGDFIPLVGDDSAETIRSNMKHFEDYCIDHGIEYRVHKDYFNFALPELKKESRFADLLIVSSESFFASDAGQPNEFLEEMLHDAECPVLLVPDHFEFPKQNVLAYDGSASSVYAIRQFAYLLPELAANPTVVLQAHKAGTDPLPDELNVVELAKRHFDNLELLQFNPDPKKFLTTWLNDRRNAILVSGSFGKSWVARLFHKSFTADAIREHQLPVFIAHK